MPGAGPFISGSWAVLDPTVLPLASGSAQSLSSMGYGSVFAPALGGGFSPGFLGIPSVRIYKMRGWNNSSAQYEYWLTQYPTQPPPTGNTLQDIAVVATFIVG